MALSSLLRSRNLTQIDNLIYPLYASNIMPLHSVFDDKDLSDGDLEHGNLTYTVVLNEVLVNWEACPNKI